MCQCFVMEKQKHFAPWSGEFLTVPLEKVILIPHLHGAALTGFEIRSELTKTSVFFAAGGAPCMLPSAHPLVSYQNSYFGYLFSIHMNLFDKLPSPGPFLTLSFFCSHWAVFAFA